MLREPKVTFDVTAEEYFASAADPLNRINLNLPSVNAPVMSGQVTTTRTAMNVTNQRQEFAVSTDAPEGSSIEVSPMKLNIRPGESQTMTITINGEDLADGQYFGQISLNRKGSGLTEAVLPVAFNKTDSDVALTHSCSPDTIPEEETSGCSVTASNFSSSEANATIEVIETTAGTEAISYAFDTIQGDGDAAGGLVTGAENRDGSSGVELGAVPAGGESYAIETSPPAAGGSATITYDASGRKRGEYQIPARMTTNVTVGTTTEFAHLTVTRR